MAAFRKFLLLMALAGALAVCLPPRESHAQVSLSLDQCTGYVYADQPWRFTRKVVDCVAGSIRQATVTLTQAISNFMTPIVSAMFVLAIAVFGIRTMGGEPGFHRRGVGFAVRLGLVAIFYYNMGGNMGGFLSGYSMVQAPFDIEDQLIFIVTGNHPWDEIDGYLGRILGVGENANLTQGLVGLMGAGLMSSTAGGVMFVAGMSALVNLLLFIFRVVFTYLTAITVIGFMVAISPFIIPLAIFFHTERYFIKWIDILFSAMLVPVLLFAFLAMFLNIFDDLIMNVFRTLCGTSCAGNSGNPSYNPAYIDFSAFWKSNEPKFGWLIPTDPHVSQQVQTVTGAGSPGTPAVQVNINPLMRRAQDAGTTTMPGIDFGPTNVSTMQKLIWQFLGIWIFAHFMKSMINAIPEIAANIANAASGITMQPTTIESKVKEDWNKAQAALLKRDAKQ